MRPNTPEHDGEQSPRVFDESSLKFEVLSIGLVDGITNIEICVTDPATAGAQQSQSEPVLVMASDAYGRKPLEVYYERFGPQTVLIPVALGTKKPTHGAWQQTTFEQTRTPEYQAELLEGNIGILLGPASSDLIGIDCDSETAAVQFERDCPPAKATLQTRGARGRTFFFRVIGPYPAKIVRIKDADAKTIGEWRGGGGAQTVVSGLHPSGCNYQILNGNAVQAIELAGFPWPEEWTCPWNSFARPRDASDDWQEPITPELDKRIKAYLNTVEVAVAGEGGSNPTFRVACLLVNGFALAYEGALHYLRYYSETRCRPPWSEKEMAHKIDNALKADHSKPRGHLLTETAQSEHPLRPMLSWIDYGNKDIDHKKYHIGEGFLEIGCFIMLIGSSYVGKSTLLAQLSNNLAIGRDWLFFRVGRPLRVLIVQAEDSENKLIKMGRMYRRMKLNPQQIELAKRNVGVLTIRDLQDEKAILEIERHAIAFGPDIICINPMTSYLGSSIYKDDIINKFLRVELSPMLDRLKVSGIVVHHPPKPAQAGKEPKDLTAFELQYGGAGMAALTNAPRGNVFLMHVDGDVFKLSVGKGFEDLGTSETTAYLRRSHDESGIMLWEECDQAQADEATEKQQQRKAKEKGGKQFIAYDRLLKLFSPTEKHSRNKVIELAKKHLDKGKDWTKAAMSQLVLEKKLAKSRQKNPRGQPDVFYHLPTILEPAAGDTDQEQEDSSEG